MKIRIVLFVLFALTCWYAPATIQAQAPFSAQPIWVDGVDINALEDLQYIRLQFIILKLNEEARVVVEYGENPPNYQFGRPNLMDGDGNRITFRSKVQALNYFYQRGWKFLFLEGADYYLERRSEAAAGH